MFNKIRERYNDHIERRMERLDWSLDYLDIDKEKYIKKFKVTIPISMILSPDPVTIAQGIDNLVVANKMQKM